MLDYLTTTFGPRLSGTESYMDAAFWAKDKLELWGLEEIYFESYADNFRS